MKRKQRGLGPSGEERTEPQGGWWGEGGACLSEAAENAGSWEGKVSLMERVAI